MSATRSPPPAFVSTPPSPSLTLLPDMSEVDMAGPETPPSYSSPHRGSSPVLRGSSPLLPGEVLDTNHVLKGLPLPESLDPGESAQIASAYAVETCNVFHAEAFIAERRYRQMLMAAQSWKLHMMKAMKKYRKAAKDAARFRDAANTALADHTWNGTSGNKAPVPVCPLT